MSRHALVTGAGTGIGEAISRQLHAEGHRVTLLGRRSEPLEILSAALGDGSQTVTGDVTDRAGLVASFASAKERFGDIEILVNSAGMAPTAPFSRLDFADWQRTMDVNVNGVFHCTQIALDSMLGANWGRIINIASVASLRGFPYVSGYCASKHAVLGMTRALALEVATQGVTVNAICPGPFLTPMNLPIAETEEAIKGDDAAAMEAATTKLTEATGGVAQKMYAAQQAEGAAAGAEGAEAQPEEADQGDVVDAEFEEVKEDKRA